MGGTWGRRAVTIPATCVLLAVASATLPVTLTLALGVDLSRRLLRRRRFVALRILAFGWFYLAAQVIGLAALGAVWALTLGRPRRLLDLTYDVQRRWATALFAATKSLFGLRVEVDGLEALEHGPFILYIRHASIVDTLLPTVLVTGRYGIHLRFVLKRELLVDPCLDVAGQRLPNCFVDRRSADSATEAERVGALARGLGADDGVLIYPEGTRFSPDKQRRALARLAESDPDAYRSARELTHVMPPRLGGPLALMHEAPGVDAAFFAHAGLDGFASVRDIFARALGDRVIRVKVWRVPAGEIPSERAERVAWLLGEWRKLDRWIAEIDRG